VRAIFANQLDFKIDGIKQVFVCYAHTFALLRGGKIIAAGSWLVRPCLRTGVKPIHRETLFGAISASRFRGRRNSRQQPNPTALMEIIMHRPVDSNNSG
ncbi:MAG: hypothetical protein V4710_09155, partial [Verrucomicrobiota bacterium]